MLTFGLSSGFGLSGIPETLLKALAKRKDVKDIVAVSNNAGAGEHGLGTNGRSSKHNTLLTLRTCLVRLIKAGQLKQLMISYLGG